MISYLFHNWEKEVGKQFGVDPALVRYLYGVDKHNFIRPRYCHSKYFEGSRLTEYSKEIVKAAEKAIERIERIERNK
jgi:hypothetical protein